SAFLEAAPEVIVVTTPEPTAITDAYALIKVASAASDGGPTLRLVVNQANDVGEAVGVARKLQTVARQFLNVELQSLGYIPTDRSVPRSTRGQVPLLVAYPSSPAALRIADLARRLTSTTARTGEGDSSIVGFLRRMAGVA